MPVVQGDIAGGYRVEGSLTFDTVGELLTQPLDLSRSTSFDLAGVEHADSAGVALLLEWVRLARDNRAEIVFKNAPSKVRSLVDINGLCDVLVIGSK